LLFTCNRIIAAFATALAVIAGSEEITSRGIMQGVIKSVEKTLK
jgi:hypothetical protein